MSIHYECPHCGRTYTGRLGQSSLCACGARIPAQLSDRTIRFWIVQIAATYGFATLLLALAVFYRKLPAAPWDRLFSPLLLAPAAATVIVAYRTLVRHKRQEIGDEVLFLHYKCAMLLFAVGFLAAILAVKLAP